MNIRTMFSRASQSFVDANPQAAAVGHYTTIKDALQGNVVRRRGTMNKTETDFSLILEAQRRKGEILRWEFEGITLRFSGVKYTPDFVVFCCQAIECPSPTETTIFQHIKLIEVKGPFIRGNRERAVERFRHAKTYWPEFTFELHQKTKEGWRQVI